jgi:hypothetical protein
MPTFSLNFSESPEPLANELTTMPEDLKDRMRKGFSVLPKLSPESSRALVELVLKTLPMGRFQPDDILLSKLGLDPDSTSSLFAAVAMSTLILSNRDEDSEQFTNLAVQTGILNESNKGPAGDFLNEIIKHRQTLKRSLDQERLGRIVLPSISDFETSVEVRLRFNKDLIALAVPVAIFHISTDAKGQELWFQTTKSELNQMIEKLQKTMHRIEQSEQWAEKNPNS